MSNVNDSHQNAGGASSALDMRVIADLRELGGEDDPNLLTELIDMFLTDAPARIREVETSLANGDIKTLERAAHTLKSSSANIGAMGLSAVCKRIEELARAQNGAAIAPLLADTTQSFAEAEAALRALRN